MAVGIYFGISLKRYHFELRLFEILKVYVFLLHVSSIETPHLTYFFTGDEIFKFRALFLLKICPDFCKYYQKLFLLNINFLVLLIFHLKSLCLPEK